MSDITPRSIDPGPHTGPTRALTTGDLISKMVADLTPLQSSRVTRAIQRERMRTATTLARIEGETLVAEASIIADAKVRSTQEAVEAILHRERMDALAQAALDHEEASRIIDLVREEAAHTLFKDALKGASLRYGSGVIRRSGGGNS
ncbi:MAG TPA: hypothetical protein VHW67_05730 [Solirubrobacteraceae bacterium]|jgi:hypothetical protein|nr:hypothetical protein [Solirubrobacteraceae bacterium]